MDGNRRASATTGGAGTTTVCGCTLPAKYCGSQGCRSRVSPVVPVKDQVADYLETYALHFDLPVRMYTRVEHLVHRGGGFVHARR